MTGVYTSECTITIYKLRRVIGSLRSARLVCLDWFLLIYWYSKTIVGQSKYFEVYSLCERKPVEGSDDRWYVWKTGRHAELFSSACLVIYCVACPMHLRWKLQDLTSVVTCSFRFMLSSSPGFLCSCWRFHCAVDALHRMNHGFMWFSGRWDGNQPSFVLIQLQIILLHL